MTKKEEMPFVKMSVIKDKRTGEYLVMNDWLTTEIYRQNKSCFEKIEMVAIPASEWVRLKLIEKNVKDKEFIKSKIIDARYKQSFLKEEKK